MKERFKKLARIGIALGFAAGGTVQTLEIVNQHQQIDLLKKDVADQRETIKGQRLDIMDLQNNECWDFNLIQALGNLTLGMPATHMANCDVEFPLGHPQATPTVPSKGG